MLTWHNGITQKVLETMMLYSMVNICQSQVSQIRYLLVVILGLNSVLEIQYKDMMIDRWWKVSTGIIDIVKSEV